MILYNIFGLQIYYYNQFMIELYSLTINLQFHQNDNEKLNPNYVVLKGITNCTILGLKSYNFLFRSKTS